jgi:hypothetical protein
VSGQVDVVEVLEGRKEEDVVNAACEEAKRKAIEAGADPQYIQITSIDNMPLEYVAMKATRLIIRAVGHLPPPMGLLIHANKCTGWSSLPEGSAQGYINR